MPNLPTFSPIELQLMTDCALQYHFWQQTKPPPVPPQEQAVRNTLQYLHAGGGPHRLNLPHTLRHLEAQLAALPPVDAPLITAGRQIVAAYHRQLREEWPKIIASNELLSLIISLPRAGICCEATIDRLDKEPDGGITAIILEPTTTAPEQPFTPEDNIEATMLHALVASAYPRKRPVRLVKRRLYHHHTQTLELTERIYRRNLEKMKRQVQAWLDGELLARPGTHCAGCPFQWNGCPVYQT